MDLQTALRARLLANATINSLSGGRVVWTSRPTGSQLPSLVLYKIAPGRDWTHDGPIAMVNPRVQIETWGRNSPECAAIAAALQDEMERTDEAVAGGWRFHPPGMIMTDLWQEPDDLPGGTTAFLVTQDYRFWARPA